jgi:hypothetical protein
LPEPEPGDDPIALSRTLSEAVTQVCSRARGPYETLWIRGQCADGKAFLIPTYGGGILQEVGAYYYVNERLVGVSSISDATHPGLCPSEDFMGSLASVRCDDPRGEPLCPADAAEEVPAFEISFADGKPLHPCEDVLGNRIPLRR